MPRYVAFLKAINVGGHVVKMDRLRAIFGELGWPDAETFIASGNVILSSGARDSVALERKIGQGLEKTLGYAVPVFLRTMDEVAAVCEYKPFSATQLAKAKVVNVGFMHEPLSSVAAATARSYNTHADLFHTHGREFYWLSNTLQSESPFFKVKFHKVFKADVTFRSMTTVRKLAAKYLALP